MFSFLRNLYRRLRCNHLYERVNRYGPWVSQDTISVCFKCGKVGPISYCIGYGRWSANPYDERRVRHGILKDSGEYGPIPEGAAKHIEELMGQIGDILFLIKIDSPNTTLTEHKR